MLYPKFILTLLLCISFALVIILNIKNIYILTYKPKISYITRDHLYLLVTNNPYFNNLSQADLAARHANNTREYTSSYVDAYEEFTHEEKQYIQTLVAEADLKCLKIFKGLYKIPWRFCKLNKTIENALPHTHGDTIILSSAFFNASINHQKFLKTLIHEKVHIYQRQNRNKCEKLYASWGFIPYDKPYYDAYLSLKRSNPDISHIVYGTSDGPIMQLFTSRSPQSLLESYPVIINNTSTANIIDSRSLGLPDYIKQLEHPDEIMACMVPEYVTGTLPTTEKERILMDFITNN